MLLSCKILITCGELEELGTNFVVKRRSLGPYSSLAD
jgi:hypothetical protein